MFADVSGFTSLAEKLDPEDVTHLMNRVFETLSQIVDRYGGYIDKYIGDALMVLFGAPQAHEDDPLRAVLCALDMMKAQNTFENIGLAIGISFGKVYAGKVGSRTRQDYTVMGDTVNLAQRLQAAAGKGKIYVSESVYRATRFEIEYEEVGAIRVKGKETPVRVWIPLRVKAERPLRKLDETPLIDRNTEFQKLLAWFEDAQAGKGRVVGIIGEAGIGKTKLVKRFLEHVAQYPVRILEAHGVEYRKDSEYFMIKQILQSLIGFEERDSKESIGEKIERFFYTRGKEEASPIVLSVKYLFAVPLSEKERYLVESMKQEDRVHVLNRWIVLLFEHLSEEQPLVLVLDDFQWADRETVRFCMEFGQRVGGKKVLMLVLSRSRFWRGEARFSAYKEIHLMPLEKEDGLELARKILGCEKMEPELEALILERSGGNPFYIEELLETLLQKGFVSVRDGVVRLTTRDFHVIPTRIGELVLSRIDRLPQPLRNILAAAAVIGDEFTESLLARVLSFPSNLHDHLETLKKEGFFREIPVKTGSPRYAFRHSSVRDMVYEALPRSKREVYHRKVLRAMEDLLRDEVEEALDMLVYHARMGGDRERLEVYLEQLGRKEIDLGRYRCAEVVYEDLVEHMGNRVYSEERGIQVLLTLAEIKQRLAKYREGLKILERLSEKGQKAMNEEQRIRLLLQQSVLLASKGYDAEALVFAKRAEVLLRSFPWPPLHKECYRVLGNLYLAQKRYDKAYTYFRKALSAASLHSTIPVDLAERYRDLGRVHLEKGEHELALENYEKALRIWENTLGERHPGVGDVHHDLGVLYTEKGEHALAFEHVRKALHIWKETLGEQHPSVAEGYRSLGDLYAATGNHEKAIEHYNRALHIRRRILGAKHPKIAENYFCIGEAYFKEGHQDLAFRYYEKSLLIWLEAFGEDHPDVAWAYHGIGKVLERRGKREQALFWYERARVVREKSLGPEHPLTLKVFLDQARMLRALGRTNEARECLRKIVDAGLRLRRQKVGVPWLDDAEALLKELE